MEEIMAIPIVTVIFFSIAYTIKVISDNGVRNRIINKGTLDENVKFLFQKQASDYVPNSLKWGMVLMAIGLAVLVGELAPYGMQEEITVSAMFIFGGAAMIVYYFLASKMLKKNRDE